MSRTTLIGARDRTAAKLLDLPLEKFLIFVSAGDLPDGREIVPGEKRWDVETLKQIVKGDFVTGDEEIQW